MEQMILLLLRIRAVLPQNKNLVTFFAKRFMHYIIIIIKVSFVLQPISWINTIVSLQYKIVQNVQ